MIRSAAAVVLVNARICERLARLAAASRRRNAIETMRRQHSQRSNLSPHLFVSKRRLRVLPKRAIGYRTDYVRHFVEKDESKPCRK